MTKLKPHFQHYLERSLELTPEEIRDATPNEIFDLVLAYEGYGQHAGFLIRDMIQNIYDVDLTDLSQDELINRKEVTENE